MERLVARAPGIAARHEGEQRGDALIVAACEYAPSARELVAAARRRDPGRPIVVLCPPALATQALGDAFADGADDVVPWATGDAPDDEAARALAFAIEKAAIRRRGAAAPGADAERNVICVLGPKGGSGKTMTAVNLSVALAEGGHSVALMDLDLQFGDVALAMGLTPRRTVSDLVRAPGPLDAGKLEAFLVEHPSGARALLAPVAPDQAAAVTVPFLQDVQGLLGTMFEFVVIDTPPSFAPEVTAAVHASDGVLLVATRDTLALKDTRLGLEMLERMDYDRRRVTILLNRANTNVGVEREDVLAILGRDVDALVPSHRDITRSINQGEPIATRRDSEAAPAFRALAQEYVEAAGVGGDDRVVQIAAARDPDRAATARRAVVRRGRRGQ
jgi:pilus assembly protein CpaE